MSESLIRGAYAKLDRSEIASLLQLFTDDAKFFVPGATPISGDHPRGAIGGVLEQIAQANVKRDLLDFLISDHSVAVVVHEYVGDVDYHAIHVWDLKDGKVPYLWFYVHEYDRFERAWA
ncbi:MAG: nuclear transport factor 2 family protein [Candidatus Binatia bacterium]